MVDKSWLGLSNPPSPKSPYQPQAGLIGIIYGSTESIMVGLLFVVPIVFRRGFKMR